MGISLTVTVLGTGTMGQGIAQVTAQSGHTTRLFDAADVRLKRLPSPTPTEVVDAPLEPTRTMEVSP